MELTAVTLTSKVPALMFGSVDDRSASETSATEFGLPSATLTW